MGNMDTQSTLESPRQEGLLAPAGLVPTSEFKKGGRGEVLSKCRRQCPWLHFPQAGGVYEGFGNYYNHLLCWVEKDPVSLCFRL